MPPPAVLLVAPHLSCLDNSSRALCECCAAGGGRAGNKLRAAAVLCALARGAGESHEALGPAYVRRTGGSQPGSMQHLFRKHDSIAIAAEPQRMHVHPTHSHFVPSSRPLLGHVCLFIRLNVCTCGPPVPMSTACYIMYQSQMCCQTS